MPSAAAFSANASVAPVSAENAAFVLDEQGKPPFGFKPFVGVVVDEHGYLHDGPFVALAKRTLNSGF